MSPKDISYQQETLRKSTHFIALLIPISYLIFPHTTSIAAMASATVVIALFEIVRLRRLRPWRYLRHIVGGMIRPKERRENFTGAFYIIFCGLVCIVAFPKEIAFTAMTMEILGDVGSALVGRKYGKHIIRGSKSVEGAAAFLVIAILIVVIVPKVPFTIGVIGAIVAAVVEAVSIHRDDNLTVPLSCGLVMFLLMRLFPQLP